MKKFLGILVVFGMFLVATNNYCAAAADTSRLETELGGLEYYLTLVDEPGEKANVQSQIDTLKAQIASLAAPPADSDEVEAPQPPAGSDPLADLAKEANDLNFKVAQLIEDIGKAQRAG